MLVLKHLFKQACNFWLPILDYSIQTSTTLSSYKVKILTKAACLPRKPRVHCCLHGFQTINPKRYRTNIDVFANVLKKGLLYFVKTYCGKKIIAVSKITGYVGIHDSEWTVSNIYK